MYRVKALKIAASILVVLSAANCPGPTTQPTAQPVASSASGLKTRVGDGSWAVGDEIASGRWSPVDDWQHMSECVWYISPIAQQVGGTPSPIPKERLVIALHRNESFTTYHCGMWEWIGE